MQSELYLIDPEGAEIPNSRHTVDYDRDRDGYFMLKEQLQAKSAEGCLVLDTAVDGRQ